MPFEREQMKLKAMELADAGVFIGTSSWKYQGWLNQLYTPARYEYRGKVATTRFERSCLAEYAEVFKTVCVDAAYYTFPSEKYLDGLVAQVPSDFQFGSRSPMKSRSGSFQTFRASAFAPASQTKTFSTRTCSAERSWGPANASATMSES